MPMMEQLQTLLTWGVLFSFFAIPFVGLTNRIVIFYDHADFMWAISPFLSILIGVIIAATLTPEGGETTLAGKGMMLLAGIFAFKVMSSVLAALLSLGGLSNAFWNSDAPLGQRITALLMFGALAWLMGKLINGEAVYARRALSDK